LTARSVLVGTVDDDFRHIGNFSRVVCGVAARSAPLGPGLTARRPVDALNDLAAAPSAGDMSIESAGSL
jgi:hypothetical protein